MSLHAWLTGKTFAASLLRWLLMLSLIPMALIFWFGYWQTRASLSEAARYELEQESALHRQFIQSWFDYRLMELNSLAENRRNARFLRRLKQALERSSMSAQQLVQSYEWERIVDVRQNDLRRLPLQYDYIYDVFLIDDQGNILFTLVRENDLGQNLFNGALKDTFCENGTAQSGKRSVLIFRSGALSAFGG